MDTQMDPYCPPINNGSVEPVSGPARSFYLEKV